MVFCYFERESYPVAQAGLAILCCPRWPRTCNLVSWVLGLQVAAPSPANSKYFKMSPVCFSSDHLLRRVLFNLHIPGFFFQLSFYYSSLAWFHMVRHYMVLIFKLTKKRLMIQDAVCLGGFSLWTWEENIICCSWIKWRHFERRLLIKLYSAVTVSSWLGDYVRCKPTQNLWRVLCYPQLLPRWFPKWSHLPSLP